MATKQTRAVPTAATYGRVSTDAQEREGTSLETQEEACRTLAIRQGYRVAEGHVYRESHSGSELWDRPLLTALRDAVRQRLIDAVIVYETGRLSRDPVHLLIIAEECAHWGVALIFVQDPVDTSDEGRLMLHVKGYAAKLEREKIRERQLRAKYFNAQAGRIHNHGVDLYGYRRDK